MIYNNREYPYPVLGINDDIEGDFKVHMNVKAGKQTIKIEPIYELDNNDLNDLIEKGLAVFVAHLYCKGTMYRKCFRSSSSVGSQIVVSTSKLRERVEVDFMICANDNISNYSNSESHSDYNGYTFPIEKGDILAFGGKGVFNANKTPEELRAVSSFMNIDKYESAKGPIYNHYDGDKITILLSENDYILYQQIVDNPFVSSVLHSSIVLPCLIDAIDTIKSDSSDFVDCSWYNLLSKLIDDSKQENLLKIAQKILENPVNRAFNTIQNMIEYDNE